MHGDSSADLTMIRGEPARHGLTDVARVHRFDARRRTGLGEWAVVIEVLEEFRSTPFRTHLPLSHVPHMRLHDLRHLHASLLIRRGLDPRTIADRIGRTDPAFTMRRYSQMFDEHRRSGAVSLAELLGPDGPTNRARSSKQVVDPAKPAPWQ